MKVRWILLATIALGGCATDEEPAQGALQLAEMIEVHGCRPGDLETGEGDNRTCIDPWGGWGPPPGPAGGLGDGDERPLPGPGGMPGGGGGGSVPEVRMDPEPDRNKDLKSCWEWCQWNRRQCEKECWHKFPAPFGDWHKHSMCIQDICEDHDNPNIGRKACQADCNDRWRDRP